VPVRSKRSQNAFVSEGTSTYCDSQLSETFMMMILLILRDAV
jgi:hypothetical protein